MWSAVYINDFSGSIIIGFCISEFSQEVNDLAEVRRRIKMLEDSQKPSVESTLHQVRMLLKAPIFSKDQALDYLLSLSMVAKESSHAKAGFYQAVLRALRDKANSSEAVFKKYLEVLLGDKDEEKVMEMMAKVDKSSKHSLATHTSGGPGASGRGLGRFGNIQCFHCNQLGHYMSHCPRRVYFRRGGRGRANRRDSSN